MIKLSSSIALAITNTKRVLIRIISNSKQLSSSSGLILNPKPLPVLLPGSREPLSTFTYETGCSGISIISIGFVNSSTFTSRNRRSSIASSLLSSPWSFINTRCTCSRTCQAKSLRSFCHSYSYKNRKTTQNSNLVATSTTTTATNLTTPCKSKYSCSVNRNNSWAVRGTSLGYLLTRGLVTFQLPTTTPCYYPHHQTRKVCRAVPGLLEVAVPASYSTENSHHILLNHQEISNKNKKSSTTFFWISYRYSSHSSIPSKVVKMSGKKKVCIIGSGNWGSAISKIVGVNTAKYTDDFDEEVKMYVYEELVNGRKLTEIINQDHENAKYLPGHKLPKNIIAVPDVLETAKDADILIFVLPHQFIKNTCKPLVGKMKPGAVGLSLIKGFDVAEGGGIELISHVITNFLGIPCNVLMGANLAGEIADEKFSETTIGAHDEKQGKILHKLIQADYFRVVVVNDVETVEMCGALKNIVAVGAGFIDGLQYGDNTKAAVIRLGLMEMVRFAQEFYGTTTQLSTFLESCGVADLITTCYGGRNRKVSEAFVRTGKPMEELEKEMLNGQRLQGPMTAAEVNFMLKTRGLEDKFPLFTAVHKICTGELKPPQLIDTIRNHPEHISSYVNVAAKI